MQERPLTIEFDPATNVATAAAALSDKGVRSGNCPNCGAPMIGTYCAVCGQERDNHRRSVLRLGGDIVGEVASFDSRILRTAVALIARPGELSSAFREGRPRRYVPALRLYLFVSLTFFLVLSATGIAIVQLQIEATPVRAATFVRGHSFLVENDGRHVSIPDWMAKEHGPHYDTAPHMRFFARDLQSKLTPGELANLHSDMQYAGHSDAPGAWGTWISSRVLHAFDILAANPAAVNRPLTQWLPRLLFVLLPLYALLLAAFYWRRRKSYFLVDHLVFSLNVHTFAFVAILAAVGAAQLLSGVWVALAALAAIGIYILLAIRRFYGQNWFWTCAKGVAVSSLYAVFCLVPATAAIVVVSLLQI